MIINSWLSNLNAYLILFQGSRNLIFQKYFLILYWEREIYLSWYLILNINATNNEYSRDFL